MQLPPMNLDAEQATLGAILLNREAIAAVASWLKPTDFYSERHSRIYTAMLACYEQRTPPDMRLVAAALKAKEQLDEVGGIAYLNELTDCAPTAYHIEHYARTVERYAILRGLIAAAGTIATLGYDTTGRAVSEIIADAQAALTSAARNTQRKKPQSLDAIMNRIHDRMSRAEMPGVSSGFRDIDKQIGSLRAGKLYVLGGRPGQGKSALALNIAAAVAEQGAPVLYISLEMEADELGERLISMYAGVNTMAISANRLADSAIDAVMPVMARLPRLPIQVEDVGGLSLAEIRATALQFAAEQNGIGLLVVDYLTLMTIPTARGENRATAVGLVANGLKTLSKELQCPILCLAQLNRALDTRADMVPQLSDLRESGDIEAAADLVAFTVIPSTYAPNDASKQGQLDLWIRKQRGGPTGRITLVFDAPTTRVKDAAPVYREPVGYDDYNRFHEAA